MDTDPYMRFSGRGLQIYGINPFQDQAGPQRRPSENPRHPRMNSAYIALLLRRESSLDNSPMHGDLEFPECSGRGSAPPPR